jgi:hypothetical protein
MLFLVLVSLVTVKHIPQLVSRYVYGYYSRVGEGDYDYQDHEHQKYHGDEAALGVFGRFLHKHIIHSMPRLVQSQSRL